MPRVPAFRTVALVVLLGFPAGTAGQSPAEADPACERYEDCALRVRHGLFGTAVVRGAEGVSVADIGWTTPPLEPLFARSDRATASFRRFRTDHRRASWLGVLGGVEIVGGLVARARDADDWAMALSISGVVVEVVATVFRTRADEHLSEAIWWYNASLVEGPGR